MPAPNLGATMRSMLTRLAPISNRESVELDGERVLLRPLRLTDAADMLLFVSDPEVTRYLPWNPAPDIETVQNFLREHEARRRRGESLGFAIVHKATDTVVGSTDLFELKTARGHAEIGYLLSRSYWGQGIMHEAANLTIAYAFRSLGVGRLCAWADKENVRSQHVLEKLGMHLAGSEVRTVKNEIRPYVRYELLRSMWEIEKV
jgi:[ribosomal protein S5]-alanine N-acetyltransferase